MKLKELVKQFIPMNYWNTRRKASIIRQQGKVADFWAPILKAYYNGEIERYSLKPKKVGYSKSDLAILGTGH